MNQQLKFLWLNGIFYFRELSMKVYKKIGHISSYEIQDKSLDNISFEWFEVHKRISHKISQNGTSLQIKFLNENPNFQEGDILYETSTHLGIVQIIPCKCLVIQAKEMQTLAAACYEIGNRHLPLFMEGNELMVAYDKPLSRYFEALNYVIKIEERKLLKPLRTTVAPHSGNKGLFTKIMQLTQS